MKEVKAIIQPFVLDAVIDSLRQLPHLPGLTVSTVEGYARSGETVAPSAEVGEETRMSKVEVVVADDLVERVVETIVRAARTGRGGDGKVFVSEVIDVIKIRTGERGDAGISHTEP